MFGINFISIGQLEVYEVLFMPWVPIALTQGGLYLTTPARCQPATAKAKAKTVD